MTIEELNIWENDAPVIVLNNAPKPMKEFQIWIDGNTPLVDIYDSEPDRRRVFMF